jgi:hypothetical protein
MYDNDFYAPDYLYDQFGGTAENTYRSDVDPWTLTLDAGFWVRRFIDGTANECWKLLSAIMSNYDQVWFERVWDGWEMPEEYYPEDEGGEYGGI